MAFRRDLLELLFIRRLTKNCLTLSECHEKLKTEHEKLLHEIKEKQKSYDKIKIDIQKMISRFEIKCQDSSASSSTDWQIAYQTDLNKNQEDALKLQKECKHLTTEINTLKAIIRCVFTCNTRKPSLIARHNERIYEPTKPDLKPPEPSRGSLIAPERKKPSSQPSTKEQSSLHRISILNNQGNKVTLENSSKSSLRPANQFAIG